MSRTIEFFVRVLINPDDFRTCNKDCMLLRDKKCLLFDEVLSLFNQKGDPFRCNRCRKMTHPRVKLEKENGESDSDKTNKVPDT